MKNLILPHHPIPFPDEFIASFLLRASYSNGYQSPKQMLNRAGILVYTLSFESIFTNETKFLQVLRQLNLPHDSLDLVIKKVPPTFQQYFWENNQIIKAPLLTIKFKKFCPTCLKNKGYWKKDWLLNPLTVCTEHKTNLINDCPNCKNPLSVNRRSLFECSNCHYDIRDHTSELSNKFEMKINHWFLNNLKYNDEKFMKIFCNAWVAMNEYFFNLNIEVNNYFILNLVYDYFKNEDQFIAYFNKKIKENLIYAHPRIQLLPFLKAETGFFYITKQLLEEYQYYNNFSSKPINRIFNKSEARYILGICFASFHKWLKSGILQHDQLSDIKKNTFSSKILEDWMIADTININNTYKFNQPPQKINDSNLYYSIPEIMQILDINNSNTRLFLRIPDIPTTKKSINCYSQYCLEKEFVNNFKEKYIFLGPLAKYLNVSVITLRAKLSSLKIEPVYSSKLYPAIYAKKDIQHLNKSMIEDIVTFQNNLGRKKNGAVIKRHNSDLLSLKEAAQLLNIKPYHTAILIKYNILLVDNKDARPYRIPRRNVDRILLLKNDPTYVLINDVCEALNCTENELKKNWIMSGFLTLRHIYWWKTFPKYEVDKVLEIHREFFTASEANDYLGMHRTHITNLTARGLVQAHRYGNDKYFIRLFKKDDVKKLLEAGYGVRSKQKKS